MILNIVLGFVAPWAISIMHLYKKEKLLLILVAPLFSVVAYTINTFGFYFGFWEITPFPNQKNLASLPFDLGIYPVLASYLIFFIRRFKKPYFVVFLMTLFTTFLELIFLYFGRIIYGNDWNILLTFFSYLFPYLFVYGYYKYLIKLNVIK